MLTFNCNPIKSIFVYMRHSHRYLRFLWTLTCSNYNLFGLRFAWVLSKATTCLGYAPHAYIVPNSSTMPRMVTKIILNPDKFTDERPPPSLVVAKHYSGTSNSHLSSHVLLHFYFYYFFMHVTIFVAQGF